MRKAAFQGILGVSIAVSAISLGIMLTRFLALRSYSPKAPPAAASSAAAPPGAAPVSPGNWKNIFAPSAGMLLPARRPAVTGRPAPAGARSNYTLLGTIVSTRPGDSRAILWADGMKLPAVIRIDTEVEPGAVLVSVTRDKAWIARGPVREELDLLPVGSKARSPVSGAPPAPAARASSAAARRSAPSGPADATLQVERLGENSFSIDEAGVAQLTNNINQFMTHVRLVPYFEGNTSAGYRIAAIRPGTAFEKLGFQGGDVLQQVNGVALTSPEKMYTIFQNLKDEKQVTVDIIRQGKKSTLKYEIR
jgi:type II secretion system protein C